MAVTELTKETFDRTIAQHPFAIIDFWAPWCGPCLSFAPVFEAVSEKHPNILFAKVNTEQEQELAAQFQIRSIPTLMIIRDNIIIYAQPGALPESALEDLITQAENLDMDEVRKQLAEQQAQQPGA